VERDLYFSPARWTWEDVESGALPFDAFKSGVLYAPPGTAVYHQLHSGWTINDHLAAHQLDVLNLLWWAKTEDGQKNRRRPQPTPKPGMTKPEDTISEFAVAVDEYERMVAEWDDKHKG
jgi:hypothetical protein